MNLSSSTILAFALGTLFLPFLEPLRTVFTLGGLSGFVTAHFLNDDYSILKWVGSMQIQVNHFEKFLTLVPS